MKYEPEQFKEFLKNRSQEEFSAIYLALVSERVRRMSTLAKCSFCQETLPYECFLTKSYPEFDEEAYICKSCYTDLPEQMSGTE